MSRYYRADLERHHPISTEITGYAISTLLYLHAETGDSEYLQRAVTAARFLCREAWDGSAMPFETDPTAEGRLTYFFDCGIVVRALLSAWRTTGEQEFLDVATSVAAAMAQDFRAPEGHYHAILSLPGKHPLECDDLRWSRSPGCYQLKSAMAWWELSAATGDTQFGEAYRHLLDCSLKSYNAFLPGGSNPLKVVDRLHAFLYFLEGLLPCAGERRCAAVLSDGIRLVEHHAAETRVQFERCDVYAQLLRIRIYADWAGAVSLDWRAAQHEASALAAFQATDPDPRIGGGFYFGRKDAVQVPYVNPVSTAFGLQALSLWQKYQSYCPQPDPRLLI